MTERERQRQRERVLVVFDAHREVPGAAFDEGHFLDFLIDSPGKKRAVYDSARGMRRLEAFIEHIELEYSICFSLAEVHANYPLDAFVARIAALVESPRTSLASFQGQAKAVYGWPVFVLGNFVLLLPLLMVLQRPLLATLFALLLLALDGAWFLARRRYATYRERLRQQLRAAVEAHRNQAAKRRIESLG